MHFTIDQSDRVIIDDKIIGAFRDIQEEIQETRMDLVQKYKIKAIYKGDAKFRYIADWELIIKEYYEGK